MPIQFIKRILICVCLLSFSLPNFAQKKYTEKDLAALKQTLMQTVAGKSKEVQVMVDQIFSFAELGFQEVETSKYITTVLTKNGFTVENGISNIFWLN